MNKILTWFNQYNPREQLIILLGAACLLLYVLYLSVWRPLAEQQQQLQLQNQRAQETLVNVKVLADQYKQLQQTGATSQSSENLNLSQIVDRSVASNQLSMKRYQPAADGDAQIRFENMPFDNLLSWLDQMENRYGLLIKDLTVSPGSQVGLVNLSVRLSPSN